MSGVLLDSGPLVLYIYGRLRPDMVGKGKTKQHTIHMCSKLLLEVRKYSRHFSLPNVLTEASNHLGAGAQQSPPNAAQMLATYAGCLEEIYKPSRDVVRISEYLKVGLADAAVISCAPLLVQNRIKVFTQDFELYQRLSAYNVICTNIMHWGTPNR